MNASALLHRAIVAISGMPDHWATPMNTTPGHVDIDTHEAWKCQGECVQGRQPENCRPRYVLHPELHRVTLTELDNDAPPSDAPFRGQTSAEKRAERERKAIHRRANWLAAFQALVGLVGFAATLALLAPKN